MLTTLQAQHSASIVPLTLPTEESAVAFPPTPSQEKTDDTFDLTLSQQQTYYQIFQNHPQAVETFFKTYAQACNSASSDIVYQLWDDTVTHPEKVIGDSDTFEQFLLSLQLIDAQALKSALDKTLLEYQKNDSTKPYHFSVRDTFQIIRILAEAWKIIKPTIGRFDECGKMLTGIIPFQEYLAKELLVKHGLDRVNRTYELFLEALNKVVAGEDIGYHSFYDYLRDIPEIREILNDDNLYLDKIFLFLFVGRNDAVKMSIERFVNAGDNECYQRVADNAALISKIIPLYLNIVRHQLGNIFWFFPTSTHKELTRIIQQRVHDYQKVLDNLALEQNNSETKVKLSRELDLISRKSVKTYHYYSQRILKSELESTDSFKLEIIDFTLDMIVIVYKLLGLLYPEEILKKLSSLKDYHLQIQRDRLVAKSGKVS